MKHNNSGAMIDVPSIKIRHFNKSRYTWNVFLVEHKLFDSIEVAYFCSSQSGKKSHYVKVGSLGNSHYTIADPRKADKKLNSLTLSFGCRRNQKTFINSLA
jgi:hypothetical protein